MATTNWLVVFPSGNDLYKQTLNNLGHLSYYVSAIVWLLSILWHSLSKNRRTREFFKILEISSEIALQKCQVNKLEIAQWKSQLAASNPVNSRIMNFSITAGNERDQVTYTRPKTISPTCCLSMTPTLWVANISWDEHIRSLQRTGVLWRTATGYDTTLLPLACLDSVVVYKGQSVFKDVSALYYMAEVSERRCVRDYQ